MSPRLLRAAGALSLVPAFLILGLAPPAPIRTRDSILPGYWERTDRVLGFTKVERRCIRPPDIAKVMSGPSNHIYACEYPTEIIGGGHIRFRGQCVDSKGRRFDIAGEGAYTHTTLNMTAEVRGSLMGAPLALMASTDAHRLGDTCPTDAPDGSKGG